MSGRKSTSVYDMPGTPLLTEPSEGDNPFRDDDVAPPSQDDSRRDSTDDPPMTPRPYDDLDLENRRKKRITCGGILVLGLVIIGALIIIAVKQSETNSHSKKLGPDLERQRNMEDGDDVTTDISILETTTESYQDKIRKLYNLVSECNRLGSNSSKCSATVLGEANESSIDDLIEELKTEISEVKFNETVGSFETFSAFLSNLSQASSGVGSGSAQTNYASVISILQPYLVETPGARLTVDDGRSGGDGDNEDRSSSITYTYTPPQEVQCDQVRERRCRDKGKCYPVSAHCDFKVDCPDNSDEDSCSCVDRLVDDRLCDGYTDCDGGEDEANCGCPDNTSFLCSRLSSSASECLESYKVCDGVDDCSNGLDEKDCLILVPSLSESSIDHKTASKSGYVSIWNHTKTTFVPMALSSNLGGIEFGREIFLQELAMSACNGVRGSLPLRDMAPIPEGYTGLVFNMDTEEVVRADSLSGDYQLLSVFCGEKQCGTKHVRTIPQRGIRVKRGDNFRPECEEKYHNMTQEQQKAYEQTEEFKVWCDMCNDPSYTEEEVQHCQVQAKIVGGQVSYPDSWPYTVAIHRDGAFICGGTIIAPDWVITAGHCVYGHQANGGQYYTVRAGMLRRQSQAPWEQHRHASELYIHPNYDNQYLRHDIALIKLNSPLAINTKVQEICLPYNSSMFPDSGSTCIAAGWGDLSENGPSSEQLRYVEVPILAACGHSYNNMLYQVCGGYTSGGKDACQGDSGGPLYCRDNGAGHEEEAWYLGGVISHGKGCARANEAGVYTKTAYYLDWIHSIMSGYAEPEHPRQQCGGLQCGSGECVPWDWVCDSSGIVDCLDGDDVRGCTTLVNGTRVRILEDSDKETPDIAPINNDEDSDNIYQYNQVECDPEQFKCSSLEQCIPATSRCDGFRNCPDWSDESGCLCVDHLPEYQLCDDVQDCRDGSDEDRCDLCEENEYRCVLSRRCIPLLSVCNTVYDCEYEEDERFCTALTNTSHLAITQGGDPLPQNSGTLLLKQFGVWSPICLTQLSFGMAATICSYMGYNGTKSYSMVDPGQFDETVPTIAMGRSELPGCKNVEIECDQERCGQRPAYRNLGPHIAVPQQGTGTWPWQASLFSEGVYTCGGTIVSSSFIITHLRCAQLLVNGGRFITVLVGQDRRTAKGLSPHSQIRRIVSLKVVQDSANVVLAQMSEPLVFDEYVNSLCLGSSADISLDSCAIAGATHSSFSNNVFVADTRPCEDDSGELCFTTFEQLSEEPINWSGVLSCQNSLGHYYGTGVYFSDDSDLPRNATPFTDLSSIMNIILAAPDVGGSPDNCPGFRCRLGQCLADVNKVCNRHWDCQEGEDEEDCPDVAATSLPMCSRLASDTGECVCPEGTRKCDNNLCLGQEQWCNNMSECGDMSDEPATCATCLGKLGLTSPRALCDNNADCSDLEDETPSSCGCPEQSWRCDTGFSPSNITGECIELSALCDGFEDCSNGEDENPAQCISLSPEDEILQNKLLVPIPLQSGFLKVRTYGIWFTYCTPTWSQSEATAICQAIGYRDNRQWRLDDNHQAPSLNSLAQSNNVNCSTIYMECL